MRRCHTALGGHAGRAREAPLVRPAIVAVLAAAGVLSAAAASSAGTAADGRAASLSRTAPTARPLLDHPGGRTASSAQALGAVSCTSASFCEALAGLNAPKAAEWNGSTWTVQSMPAPSGGSGLEMTAVSCTAQTACEAVGDYTNKIGAFQPVVEHWDGTSWSVQAVLAPGGKNSGDGMLEGVSCVTASACEAVGTYLLDGGLVTLAEVWNGHTWQQQPAPHPGLIGAMGSGFGGVSCTAANNCEAVGWFTNRAVREVTLAEAWNGSAWKVQSTPSAKTTDSTMTGVSCPGASRCEAVGDSGNTQSNFQAIAEAWNGTSWSAQPVAQPAAAFNLLTVSCAAADACEAAGDGTVLAEGWNGTRWTAQSVPGSSGGRLNGISCPAAKDCEATGFKSGSGGLAELWNGTTWAAQPVP